MSRRGTAERRTVVPDPKYSSTLIALLINRMMLRGQKATAEKIVYKALELIQAKTKKDPLSVLEPAIRNATPLLEVKPRRVGGATYQVPIEVRQNRGFSLALRWLVAEARKRPGKSMIEKLAGELIDASQGAGGTVKKREDTHKMAEANRAFVHYRWYIRLFPRRSPAPTILPGREMYFPC